IPTRWWPEQEEEYPPTRRRLLRQRRSRLRRSVLAGSEVREKTLGSVRRHTSIVRTGRDANCRRAQTLSSGPRSCATAPPCTRGPALARVKGEIEKHRGSGTPHGRRSHLAHWLPGILSSLSN